eukprot:jgi/Mesvir1/8640/Mv26103-RA.1
MAFRNFFLHRFAKLHESCGRNSKASARSLAGLAPLGTHHRRRYVVTHISLAGAPRLAGDRPQKVQALMSQAKPAKHVG